MSAGASAAGLVMRSAPEITRVLEALRAERMELVAQMPPPAFRSALLLVDPAGGRLVLGAGADPAALSALVARPRCSFHGDGASWHIEFAAVAPQAVRHLGAPAVQCRFPELVVTHPRRAAPRAAVAPPLPMRVLADAGGFAAFDARLVDVGEGGIGFLDYSSTITLEPGTVLRGCRVSLPEGGVVVADLEVRYSRPVTLPDGSAAVRSGCRFVTRTPQTDALVARYLPRAP